MNKTEYTFSNVIIEGCDLVGKSTICNELAKLCKRAEITHHIPIQDTYTFMTSCHLDAEHWHLFRSENLPTIKDRWYGISDVIYGATARQGNPVETMIRNQAAELAMIKGEVLLVVLLATEEMLEERYALRGDEFLSLEEIKERNDIYKHFVNDVKSTLVGPFSKANTLVLHVDKRESAETIASFIYDRMLQGLHTEKEVNEQEVL